MRENAGRVGRSETFNQTNVELKYDALNAEMAQCNF